MDLDLFGHLITSIVVNEMAAIRNLLAALKTASEMVHLRDPETGAHLDRMSRFSRLIAEGLVANGKYDFNDEFIEYIFLFSPLHDIGKIGIPDNILLKPGRLNSEEFEVMKTHASKGRQMIDSMVKCFGLETFRSIDVLRNIAECHHESLDGSGYPHGLKGQQIPIEARIITVADIFDALASPRPYKRPWNNEDAFALLEEMQEIKLDPDCVMVLVNNKQRVEEIQQRFRD